MVFFTVYFSNFLKKNHSQFCLFFEEKNMYISFSQHQMYINFIELIQQYDAEQQIPEYNNFQSKLFSTSNYYMKKKKKKSKKKKMLENGIYIKYYYGWDIYFKIIHISQFMKNYFLKMI